MGTLASERVEPARRVKAQGDRPTACLLAGNFGDSLHNSVGSSSKKQPLLSLELSRGEDLIGEGRTKRRRRRRARGACGDYAMREKTTKEGLLHRRKRV